MSLLEGSLLTGKKEKLFKLESFPCHCLPSHTTLIELCRMLWVENLRWTHPYGKLLFNARYQVGLSGSRAKFLIASHNNPFFRFVNSFEQVLCVWVLVIAGSYNQRHINYQLDHKLVWKLLLKLLEKIFYNYFKFRLNI